MDYMDADSKAAKEAELNQYLNSAKAFIKTEGITLDLSRADDCQLVIMYAGWLYEKRKAQSSHVNLPSGGMPRMLRWALNNRLFEEKVA